MRAEERRDIDAHLQRHGRSTVVVGAAATLAAVPPTDSAPDLDVIAAEIAAEVHRRRASGEFPPDLERRLDAAFARYSPPGSLGATAEGLLARAEECTAIDTDPPTSSQRAGVPVVKQGIKRAMAWYINFVAGQVSALGGHLVAAGRVLDRRVTRLESLVSEASDIVAQERRFAPAPALDDGTVDAIARELGSIEGRVLHAECRTAALVERLVGAGTVAYGVEPRRELLVDASRRGLDVRPDDALEHLRRLPEKTLAAVVLSGAIDTAPLAQQLELLDHAVRVTRPGGRIVIASAEKLDPIVADLALGRPLGRATWMHLLAVRGCGDARVAHESPTSFVVIASRAA